MASVSLVVLKAASRSLAHHGTSVLISLQLLVLSIAIVTVTVCTCVKEFIGHFKHQQFSCALIIAGRVAKIIVFLVSVKLEVASMVILWGE